MSQIATFAASLRRLDGIALLPYHTTAADKYARMNKPYRLAEARPLSQIKGSAAIETAVTFRVSSFANSSRRTQSHA